MKKLPKKVVLEDRKAKIREKFEEKQDVLQRATARLSELRNLNIETVEQLEGISLDWLEDEIAKSKKNLSMIFGSSGGFIPAGISRQFSDEYERVRMECRNPIAIITGTLDWCRQNGIGIKIDSKGRPWLNEKDVKELVDREATHTFSAQETEYYEYFQAIFDAMDTLRQYESENGFEPSNLQGVMNERLLACFYIDQETMKPIRKAYQFSPEEYLTQIMWGRICRCKHDSEE